MELTATRKDLLKLMARMQNIAERRGARPILSNVLFSTKDETTIDLKATDLYLSMEGQVEAQVTRGGRVAIHARDLLERIKMMPEGPVQIKSAHGSTIALKGANTERRYTLRTMAGEDFPTLPAPAEGLPTFSVGAGLLAKLIRRTHFAVSADETRQQLRAALLEWEGTSLRMVAIDGHRLARAEEQVKDSQGTEEDVKDNQQLEGLLIPARALNELRRLCEETATETPKEANSPSAGGLLRVIKGSSDAFFETGSGVRLSVKLVKEEFPPYTQVIPASVEKKACVHRATFIESLRAVSIAASGQTTGIKLTLEGGTMRITSGSSENGDGFDRIAVEYEGAPITMSFNAKYLLDALAALDEEEIELGLSGELDPALIQPSNRQGNDGRNVCVIMPMRV